MTSQYHYQLDTEYRNRRMMKAENARLAQDIQTDQPQRNDVNAFIKWIRNIVRSRLQEQVKPAVRITDTQIMQSPVNS